jgi:thiol-disulfide isomerase/thioredoxin
MTLRISRRVVLDAATAGLLIVAGLMLVHDRLMPALAERGRLDPGEHVDGDLRFRLVNTGDTVGLADHVPTLVVVFKSSCPVCEETAPSWAALARLAPNRVFPVGLESDDTAAAWVAQKLAPVEAVRPLATAAFIDRLRIRAVPTTLLFVGRKLVLARIGPLPPDDVARIRGALSGMRGKQVARALHPQSRRFP